MVGTRRRSVNPAVAAEGSTTPSTPRGGKKSTKKSDPVDSTPVAENPRVTAIREKRSKANSPSILAAQEKDSNSSESSSQASTPRTRRKAAEASLLESSKADETTITDKPVNTRTRSPQKPDTRAATPTRGKRISESSARPATPTHGKRISESSARPATPTRGTRISESEARPSTPSRLKAGDTLSVTPARKSRRLSGNAPEHLDSPLMPLKKRRSSFVLNDEVCTDDITKDSSLAVIQENLTESDSNQTKKLDIPEIVVESVETPEEDKVEDIVPKENTEEAVETNTEMSEKRIEVDDEVKDTEMKDAAQENKENEESVEMVSQEQTGNKTEVEKEISNEKTDIKSTEDQKENPAKKFISAEDRLLEQIRNQILIKKIPRQKPKSGKFWKAEREQFRQIKKDKGPRKTFEERMRQKEEKQRNNEMASMVLQEKIARKQELRRRIEENKKLKEERQLKSEVFQIVKNPNKIKRMKKRDLAKRDILGKV